MIYIKCFLVEQDRGAYAGKSNTPTDWVTEAATFPSLQAAITEGRRLSLLPAFEGTRLTAADSNEIPERYFAINHTMHGPR